MVDGLFGRIAPRFDDPELAEIAFHRQGIVVGDLPLRERLRWFTDGLMGKVQASRVERSGTVQYRPVAERFSCLDGVLNAPMPLGRAQRHFAKTGRFLTVRLPKDVELMHWTMPVPIRAEGIKNIYTILDLIPFVLPYATLGNAEHEMKMFRTILETADQIVTISEFSRSEIARIFAVDKESILNTYLSASTEATIAAAPEDEIEKFVAASAGLQLRNYLLFVGAIEPRKNVERMIDAYLKSATTLPLVVCSSSGWLNEETITRLDFLSRSLDGTSRMNGGGKRIIRINKAKDADIARLIRGARAVVFPSLYEGFGLPVLEAMQLGTPVITSNTASMAEIAADAAILVDPFAVDELARAMETISSDDVTWSQLAAAGLARAETFSPKAFAERMRVVLNMPDRVRAKVPLTSAEGAPAGL
ncbi:MULTISPECIES: glycosyltransferase family 1 protein [unclassified Beijerinckia]|uniref:glycosyltransferase family 4 protein n=1 Tax=unclassified Beijerinckia TaxID=2638183 RepID=UPI00147BDB35|nr:MULTISPECIES: glycosyltransferase family 1 protein [unclassified Beijerinckia]